MRLDPEHLRHRGGAAELGHALRVSPERQAGGTHPAHVMPRLLGQLGIQLGRVFVDLGHAVAGAQLPDHAGRMPSGAATEQALLDQHDILPTRLGQMVGHRAPHNAPSDNDHAGSRWRRSKRQREGGLDRGVADVGGRHDSRKLEDGAEALNAEIQYSSNIQQTLVRPRFSWNLIQRLLT